MNCPLCGGKPTYVGLSKIECSNIACENYPGGKQKEPVTVIGHLKFFSYFDKNGGWRVDELVKIGEPNKNGDVFMENNIVVDKFKFADRVFFGNIDSLVTKVSNDIWSKIFR